LNIRSAKLQILCILYATISSTQIYSAQHERDLHLKSLTTMYAEHRLTITNNCPYEIKLQPNESFMPEYFLPNETRTIFPPVLRGSVVSIAFAHLATNKWSNSFDVPSTTASITITETNDVFEFVTDSKKVIARFPLNK
jgi:hypothetical protein